jgi:hypothetical protein
MVRLLVEESSGRIRKGINILNMKMIPEYEDDTGVEGTLA